MGLLESILKRQVRRIVNNALDEVVDNTICVAIRDTFGQNGREGTQNYNNNYNSNSHAKNLFHLIFPHRNIRFRVIEIIKLAFHIHQILFDLSIRCCSSCL